MPISHRPSGLFASLVDGVDRGALPAVMAHRGNSSVAPENTPAAFAAAVRAGAPFIETDLRVTRDGVAVVIHDPVLERTTDASGPVEEVDLEGMRRLDNGSWFDPAFAGQRVLTSTEFVDWVASHRSLGVLLEFKGEWTPEQVAPVAADWQERELLDRVVFESFKVPTVESFRAVDPDIERGLLVNHQPAPLERAAELEVAWINPGVRLTWAELDWAASILDAGFGLISWTPDEPADWKMLTDLGAHALCTNRPDRALGYLAGLAGP